MNELYLSIFSHSFQHLIRIERVAQTVADVIDGDDGDEDHQAGEDRQPGIFDEMILRSGDEITPRGSRLLDAEAEKAETRFLDDGIAQLQGRFDDDHADPVWQDVTENDLPVGGTERPSGGDVIKLAQGEKSCADEACKGHP